MLNVEMLSTGDEVLHGQIVDTNAARLADFSLIRGCRYHAEIRWEIIWMRWSPFYANVANMLTC